MSSYFEKNLKALEYSRPLIFKLMNRCSECFPEAPMFGSEEIEGRRILYGIKDDMIFNLDSMYDSESLLDIWEAGLNSEYNSKYIMFGMGNGMYAERIIDRLCEDSMLLIYEPDCMLFRYVMEYFDLSRIIKDERVIIMFPQTEEVIESEGDLYYVSADHLDYTDLKVLKILDHLNYKQLYPEAYEYFHSTLNEVTGYMRANRDVMARFGKSFVINSFNNVPFLAKSLSIASLKSSFSSSLPGGVTGIIVSSGPSLSKNVEELKKAKGHAIIAAADSAVSVLLNHGIKPDIFFCVDAKKNPGHFTNPLMKDIAMGCDIDTTAVAFEGHRGALYFEKGENPHINSYLEEQGIKLPKLKTGGSVATTAMSFLLEIGVTDFILVGQDLAYTGDKSHAEGSLRASWDMDLSVNECMVEGYYGGQIRSSGEFVTYRKWFERKMMARPDINVINSTEGGARIEGCVQMPLSEAIEQYCGVTFDAEDFFAKGEPLMKEAQRTDFLRFMSETKGELSYLEEKVSEALKVYDEMEKTIIDNKYRNPRFAKLFARTKDISEDIKDRGVTYYVECLVQEEMTTIMDRVYESEADERAELLAGVRNGREYFEMIKKGIEQMKAI